MIRVEWVFCHSRVSLDSQPLGTLGTVYLVHCTMEYNRLVIYNGQKCIWLVALKAQNSNIKSHTWWGPSGWIIVCLQVSHGWREWGRGTSKEVTPKIATPWIITPIPPWQLGYLLQLSTFKSCCTGNSNSMDSGHMFKHYHDHMNSWRAGSPQQHPYLILDRADARHDCAPRWPWRAQTHPLAQRLFIDRHRLYPPGRPLQWCLQVGRGNKLDVQQ